MVILSAPQYEKLILLFLSESDESASSSSSGGMSDADGATESTVARERTTLVRNLVN